MQNFYWLPSEKYVKDKRHSKYGVYSMRHKNQSEFDSIQSEIGKLLVAKKNVIGFVNCELWCGSANENRQTNSHNIHIFVIYSISQFFFHLPRFLYAPSVFRRLPAIISPAKLSSYSVHIWERKRERAHIPNFTADKINWIYANAQHFSFGVAASATWQALSVCVCVCVCRTSLANWQVKRLSIALHDILNLECVRDSNTSRTLSSVHAKHNIVPVSVFISFSKSRTMRAMNRMANDVI